MATTKNVTQIKGFKPYLLMLFLNAFVDLGHKIIIQNTVFKVYDGQIQIILIAVVNAMILMPYVLLFTPAAYISDRFAFIKVMRFSAWLAVLITCFICYFYYAGAYQLAFAMTLVLAIQSTIYSPAKYGYIKQLVGEKKLTQGNALVQATTIISILLGTIVFSILFEKFLAGQQFESESQILVLIAPAAWLLILSALSELITAYRLPEDAPRAQKMPFEWAAYTRGDTLRRNLSLVTSNRTIWASIAGLSVFWGISQMALAAFPAYAKAHLGELNTVVIQAILGASGIGILFGSLWVSKISRDKIEIGLIPLGAIGIAGAIFCLPLSTSNGLLAAAFFMIGLFGAFLIAPLNALIQKNAQQDRLGTTLAANNWLQNISMLSFLGVTIMIALAGLDSKWLLHFMFVIAALGAFFAVRHLLRPLLQLVFTGLFNLRYQVVAHNAPQGFETGGLLYLGSHISWIDWALLQMAVSRPLRYVVDRRYADLWFLRWPLQRFGTVSISKGNSRSAIRQVRAALEQGSAVCLFPEGTISQDGRINPIKRGFELSLQDSGATAIPFYISGMHGSFFAKAKRNNAGADRRSSILKKRVVDVYFGSTMADKTTAAELEAVIHRLRALAKQP